MPEKQCEIHLFFEAFRLAANRWTVDEFSREVYDAEYVQEMESRRSYLMAKFKKWQADMAMFYFQLDKTNQNRYTRALCVLVEEYKREQGEG